MSWYPTVIPIRATAGGTNRLPSACTASLVALALAATQGGGDAGPLRGLAGAEVTAGVATLIAAPLRSVCPHNSPYWTIAASTRLSTTSYAILGLLASGPHTAYEIAQQMQRAFDYVWPRARSGLYTEPKLLVAGGYASVSRQHHGRRPRAVYAVTAKGRRAFAEWLDSAPVAPTIEIETILRVMFADRGTKPQLQSALRALRQQAEELQARAVAQARDYPDEGPLTDRMHLIATGGRFVHEYADLLRRYADWALAEVEAWPSTGPDAAPRGRTLLNEQLRLFGAPPRTAAPNLEP